MGFGLEFQQPFFEDPTGAGDLLDEDEDEDGWSGAYLPSAVEQTHSRVSARASPCSTYISFFSSPSELAGPESLPPWTLSDSDSRVSPVASPAADFAAHGECLGDVHLRTLQISYEAVSEGCALAPGNWPCLSSALGELLASGVLRGPGFGSRTRQSAQQPLRCLRGARSRAVRCGCAGRARGELRPFGLPHRGRR